MEKNTVMINNDYKKTRDLIVMRDSHRIRNDAVTVTDVMTNDLEITQDSSSIEIFVDEVEM